MSHEIRTPLNGVLGMASVLADTTLTEEQRDCVNTITVSGEHLLTVLNDVLDWSKQESGKLELEFAPVHLQSVVEQAIQLTYRASQHDVVDLYYRIADDVPDTITADATRLRQILANLLSAAITALQHSTAASPRCRLLPSRLTCCACVLSAANSSNALKFTGTVESLATVDAWAGSRKERQVMISVLRPSADCLQFSVRDSGIGIRADKLSQLFTPFMQMHQNKLYGGTGLGLVISQRLVTMMGGAVWAESTEGEGSTFSFTLPLRDHSGRRGSALSALQPLATAATSLSVNVGTSLPVPCECSMLMVDPNPQLMAAYAEQFARWGIQLLTATCHSSALRLLSSLMSGSAGRRLSGFIISHAADIDVLRLAEAIRQLDARGLPIIAFLPCDPASKLDVARCNEICAACMRRPVLFSQLKTVLETILSSLHSERTVGEAEAPAAASRGSPRHLTLLQPLPQTKTRTIVTARQPAFPQLAAQYPLEVLIVEDNPVNSKLLKKMLANLGYEAQTAGDGQQCLQLICTERRSFDLIFMDSLMPVMGGIDCTRLLLAWYESSGCLPVPVVCAMTASAMAEDKRDCLACGMKDFVSKPVNAARLQDVISTWGERILQERKQRTQREAEATLGDPQTQTEPDRPPD